MVLPTWLDVYRSRRVLVLLGLGFSSGLPLALTGTTLQAWMSAEQVDLRVIGIFSLVGLPYTLKMLWAPLMDRFSPPWLGRRRGWILVTQLALAAAIARLGWSTPAAAPWTVAALALGVAFLSASQDIVIDAYRTDVLAENERGAGAATSVLGYRLAMLVSGAFALILSDRLPWPSVYGTMAVLMAAGALFTLAAPEPLERALPPSSLSAAVWEPLKAYFDRSGAVSMLLFIVLFKLADAIAGAMTTPFLLDLGFSRSEVGTVNKAFGLASTLLGALAGGAAVARIGLNRSLWLFAALQAGSNLAFAALALIGHSFPAMIAAIGIENLCGGMGTAAFIAFLMSLCDKRFTATQYALLSSLMAITRVLAGAPTGYLVEALGWTWFYTVSVLGAVPGILLLPRFAPWKK